MRIISIDMKILVYRKLFSFDYDNFMKFMIFEGFNPIEQYQSWSSHVSIRVPKLVNIETKLNDESVYDWNWYILFRRAS